MTYDYDIDFHDNEDYSCNDDDDLIRFCTRLSVGMMLRLR